MDPGHGMRIVTTTRNPFDFYVAEHTRTRTRWVHELRRPDSWVHDVPDAVDRIVDAVTLDFDAWLERVIGSPVRQLRINRGHVAEADVVLRMEHLESDVRELRRPRAARAAHQRHGPRARLLALLLGREPQAGRDRPCRGPGAVRLRLLTRPGRADSPSAAPDPDRPLGGRGVDDVPGLGDVDLAAVHEPPGGATGRLHQVTPRVLVADRARRVGRADRRRTRPLREQVEDRLLQPRPRRTRPACGTRSSSSAPGPSRVHFFDMVRPHDWQVFGSGGMLPSVPRTASPACDPSLSRPLRGIAGPGGWLCPTYVPARSKQISNGRQSHARTRPAQVRRPGRGPLGPGGAGPRARSGRGARAGAALPDPQPRPLDGPRQLRLQARDARARRDRGRRCRRGARRGRRGSRGRPAGRHRRQLRRLGRANRAPRRRAHPGARRA